MHNVVGIACKFQERAHNDELFSSLEWYHWYFCWRWVVSNKKFVKCHLRGVSMLLPKFISVPPPPPPLTWQERGGNAFLGGGSPTGPTPHRPGPEQRGGETPSWGAGLPQAPHLVGMSPQYKSTALLTRDCKSAVLVLSVKVMFGDKEGEVENILNR